MKTFLYKTEQMLSMGIADAWHFFSCAGNLSLITPPEMGFQILTPVKGVDIHEGMLIDYVVKPLFGIPVKWQTEIFNVDKPHQFSDRQLKGPYRLWEHTHLFFERENEVLMKDQVKYQLPFGFAGLVAHSLLVRKKIESIFNYRKEVLNKLFNDHGNNNY